MLNFSNMFLTSATDNVEVPVASNVVHGYTYRVALSNGTSIDVMCNYDGVLNIPFPKNAENLTYIIYSVNLFPTVGEPPKENYADLVGGTAQ